MRSRSRAVTLAISALAVAGLALVPTVITAAPAAAATSGSAFVYAKNYAFPYQYMVTGSANSAAAYQTVETAP